MEENKVHSESPEKPEKKGFGKLFGALVSGMEISKMCHRCNRDMGHIIWVVRSLSNT